MRIIARSEPISPTFDIKLKYAWQHWHIDRYIRHKVLENDEN